MPRPTKTIERDEPHVVPGATMTIERDDMLSCERSEQCLMAVAAALTRAISMQGDGY